MPADQSAVCARVRRSTGVGPARQRRYFRPPRSVKTGNDMAWRGDRPPAAVPARQHYGRHSADHPQSFNPLMRICAVTQRCPRVYFLWPDPTWPAKFPTRHGSADHKQNADPTRVDIVYRDVLPDPTRAAGRLEQ